MPKVIEIIGPPGIGKSTLYRSLCKTWTPNANWIYQDALLLPDGPLVHKVSKWVEFHSKKLLGKKNRNKFPTEYGLRFVKNNPALAKFYWNHLSDARIYNIDKIDERFRSAYFLFNDFCRYQALFESPQNKFCIVNEGLLQKSFFINVDKNLVHNVINNYLAVLPLPYAIIYIDTPNTRVIFERLRNRKKVIASHIGKDDDLIIKDIQDWQYIINIIIEKAIRSNIVVLKVDGEMSVHHNVDLLRNMLRDL